MPPYFLLDNSDVEFAVIDVDSPTNFGLAIMCGPTELMLIGDCIFNTLIRDFIFNTDGLAIKKLQKTCSTSSDLFQKLSGSNQNEY
jgi:hypothetical protein